MLEGLDGGALGRKMGGICGMVEGARNWDVFGGRLRVMIVLNGSRLVITLTESGFHK